MTHDELHSVYSLLPYTAQALIDALGATAALALLDARPGCTILIPKHEDKHPAGSKRWAELAGIIGAEAMQALARRWGGDVLDIPTCKQARDELRNRAIRAEFDRLTGAENLSGNQAVYEIGLMFAPISSRAIELICGKPDAGRVEQAELF
jgi:hypothetical protein